MNNITIFISLLITIYTLYYICKTQKYLETFTDISSIDNGDIITPSTETATDLIERNEVDYNDSIYTTKYLFTNKGNKLKTKQQLSFWPPNLNKGTYSIGTAIGMGLTTLPEKKYTAIAGNEIRSPVDFEKIYIGGRLKGHIELTIVDLNSKIAAQTQIINKYQNFIDIYNQNDPAYAIAIIWRSRHQSGIKYHMVTKKTSSTQRISRVFTQPKIRHADHILIPIHMLVDMKLSYYVHGKGSSSKTHTVNGYINDDLKIIKNQLNRTTLPNTEFDLSKKYSSSMDDVSFNNYRKNPTVLKHWTTTLNKHKQIRTSLQTQRDIYQLELNNSIFSIWKPIPPKGYKTLGYILHNTHNKPILSDIKCVPERCTKEVRKWNSKDRILVLEENSKRLSIYRNPFSMTMMATLEKQVNNKWEIEKGMNSEETPVLRLYPCLSKCNFIDNLITSDQCAKDMCNKRKKVLVQLPLHNSKADTEEEKILLNEIKEQSQYLENLKKTIVDLEKNQYKFDIVNKEYNRHELEQYLKTQGILHKDTINRLLKTKNGVALNINSPGGVKALKSLLMDYLKHHATLLSKTRPGPEHGPDNKPDTKKTKILPPGCTNWTEFKQSHRCKYSDPPCFGCVNPT
jgi:hypothetical protein